jgi:hypothetical protein
MRETGKRVEKVVRQSEILPNCTLGGSLIGGKVAQVLQKEAEHGTNDVTKVCQRSQLRFLQAHNMTTFDLCPEHSQLHPHGSSQTGSLMAIFLSLSFEYADLGRKTFNAGVALPTSRTSHEAIKSLRVFQIRHTNQLYKTCQWQRLRRWSK